MIGEWFRDHWCDETTKPYPLYQEGEIWLVNPPSLMGLYCINICFLAMNFFRNKNSLLSKDKMPTCRRWGVVDHLPTFGSAEKTPTIKPENFGCA
jgi:hypothetical protein